MTSKASFLSSFFVSTFSIFETYVRFSWGERAATNPESYGWVTILKKFLYGSSMRRLQGLILRTNKPAVLSPTSDIWLLGICYKFTSEDSTNADNGQVGFSNDFSSRIWITYREGFGAISDSKLTSDVNWGCMIRSSQMLIAQALVFHHLGRSWRRPLKQPYDPEYIEILHLFGDSVASSFSIHNLLEAGRAYGLAAGSWVGPYAMCRTWESIAHSNKHNDLVNGKGTFPMAIYIVSDNEDGEQGGAPVICIERAAKLCCEFNSGQPTWSPILLLVPLVLGLENIDSRYIPSLRDTFTFPQSLGILGGKPGSSTYIVGIQDDKALYLDPHEVQLVNDITGQNLEADISSYHCNIVRHFPFGQIDPSLAIGFYCRDKGDFEDLCSRACQLHERSEEAPLFTVAQSLRSTKTSLPQNIIGDNMELAFDMGNSSPFRTLEADWHTSDEGFEIV